MWDRDLDRQGAVPTTGRWHLGRYRCGPPAAFWPVALASWLILVQLPVVAVYVGCAAVPLVVSIHWPSALLVPTNVLGLTFSGHPVEWAATQNSLPSLPVLQLYASAACWVFGYDTIYAVRIWPMTVLSVSNHQPWHSLADCDLAVGTAFIAAVGLIGTFGGPASNQPVESFMEQTGNYDTIRLASVAIGTAQSKVSVGLFKSNRDAGLCLAAGLVVRRRQARDNHQYHMP